MLGKPTCFWCIPIETVCFIFGVFSSVISGFGVVTVTLLRTWLTAITGERLEQIKSNDPDQLPSWEELDRSRLSETIEDLLIVMFLYVYFVTAFIFSVFLCYGIHKRRPGFVKVYLVYGEVMAILMVTGICVYTWTTNDYLVGCVGTLSCAFYGLVIIMVERAHQLMCLTLLRDRHQLLAEECLKA